MMDDMEFNDEFLSNIEEVLDVFKFFNPTLTEHFDSLGKRVEEAVITQNASTITYGADTINIRHKRREACANETGVARYIIHR